MPPVTSLASSPATIDAGTNQQFLADQAGDTLSCLAGSSPGDFFFSQYSPPAIDNLLGALTSTNRGRASLAEASTAEQALVSIALYREGSMANMTHEDYLMQAVDETDQDKIYHEHLMATLGLILTANTVEQRGL